MSDFLFDRDFDLELEAEEISPQSEQISDNDINSSQIREIELAAFEKGRISGEETGFAAGRDEILARVETLHTETLVNLQPQIEELIQSLEAQRKSRESDLARMVHYLAERLLPELEPKFGTRRIEAFCRRALRLSEGSEAATIHVAPQVFDHVCQSLAASLGQSAVKLKADPELAPGEARAAWAEGHAHYAQTQLHDEILATLALISHSPDPERT